jgi:hypothetical protein
MRHHVRNMSLLWGISGAIVAAGLLAACWTASVDTAYGLGYGIPWLWAMVTAWTTIVLTYRALEREKREWVRATTIQRVHTLPIREGRFDPPALPLDGRRSSIHGARPSVGGAARGPRSPPLPTSPDALSPRSPSDGLPPRKSITIAEPASHRTVPVAQAHAMTGSRSGHAHAAHAAQMTELARPAPIHLSQPPAGRGEGASAGL